MHANVQGAIWLRAARVRSGSGWPRYDLEAWVRSGAGERDYKYRPPPKARRTFASVQQCRRSDYRTRSSMDTAKNARAAWLARNFADPYAVAHWCLGLLQTNVDGTRTDLEDLQYGMTDPPKYRAARDTCCDVLRQVGKVISDSSALLDVLKERTERACVQSIVGPTTSCPPDEPTDTGDSEGSDDRVRDLCEVLIPHQVSVTHQ